MSLPTPHVQSLSTYKREWRASSGNRNISNPYNLAIPPKNNRRSKRASTSTDARSTHSRPLSQVPDTPTRPSSYRTKSSVSLAVSAISISKDSTTGDALVAPKKAIVVTEKPVYSNMGSARAASMSVYSDDAADNEPKQKRQISDRVLAAAVTFTLAVILAIAIPLGIILPQKLIKPLPVNVLVPFYGSPAQEAWDRLNIAFLQARDNKFIVMINPDHGPGEAAWPGGDYVRAVEGLKRFTNVQTVGYIDVDQGRRDYKSISGEITTYAGWSNVSSKFGLQGIAFDRSPWEYDEHSREYLGRMIEEVKQGQGFGEAPIVVLNPRHVPDGKMDSDRADVTVVYDGTYVDMPNEERLHDMMDKLRTNRQDHAMWVNGVPKELGKGGLRKLIGRIRKEVEWLYLTDLTDNTFLDLGSLWEQWTTVLW